MRQTKIVTTIGPSTDQPQSLRRLLNAGVDVVRLNFSHGDYEEHQRIINIVRAYSLEKGREITVLQDLQGPKVRVGRMAVDTVVKTGSTVTMTTKTVIGDEQTIPVQYQGLPKDVKKGDVLLLDDGLLELRVLATTPQKITAKVIHGGPLSSHKGINVPSASLSIPALTKKDLADLAFGLNAGVDYVALSFVKSPTEVEDLRRRIKRAGSTAKIVSKIEKHEAVKHFDAILEASDAVMVARGDLGVELPPENVPLIQKEIIHKANRASKPVITATQMLESMINHPRATRAEVSDIANAILDGTDAVMLSAETATGAYPLEAVQTMVRTARRAEEFFVGRPPRGRDEARTTTEAVSLAACVLAEDIGARMIVVPTARGGAARAVARHRVYRPIVALTDDRQVARELGLCWGIKAVEVDSYRTVDEMIDVARQVVRSRKLAKAGDRVVITSGARVHQAGQTNMVQVISA